MHILVLGAAGMVGRKLCERLLLDGRLGKSDITKLTMHDVVEPKSPEKAGFAVETMSSDFAVPGAAVAPGPAPEPRSRCSSPSALAGTSTWRPSAPASDR